MAFNLTERPWIPVVSFDWQRTEVSLIQLFQQWNNLREIIADNPPTTFAIYRLLVAIMHHVYQGPTDTDDWEDIRDDDGIKAIAYLRDKADYFNLLDPERPFLQDPSITQDKAAEIYQAYALHGNNTSTVFCHEHQWSGSSLSFAEAARLVLRLHLFDVGGRKTGASTSAGVIPTMDAANVLVKGATLKDEILCNLTQYDREEEQPWPMRGDDLPTWEISLNPAKARVPRGYVDYLTFQWRRIQIFAQGDRVVNIAFHPGDSLPKENTKRSYECSIAYRKTKNGLMPIQLKLERMLWRDSAAFMQTSDDYERPQLINWLAQLSLVSLIPERLGFQLLGLKVDNAKPLGWVSERLMVPTLYLENKSLYQKLTQALTWAEENQAIFRSYKGSPYQVLASVLNHPSASDIAKSLDGEALYWIRLDQLFPVLLKDLPGDGLEGSNALEHRDSMLSQWQEDVQAAATNAFIASITSIRNYEARAAALRSLYKHLAKLRGDETPKSQKKKHSSKALETRAG